MSLDISPGELIVLLGPSGSGKSTLLRTINRLIVPTAGTIHVDGRNVLEYDPIQLRRSIGYVIQAVGLFPHMSVARNVAIVPQLLGWDAPRIRQRIDELLTLVHLEPTQYRQRFPHELSGGEAQRVGVARALAAQPRVLLMDEPFGAVDAIVRIALQDEILRIHHALRTTIFFVTHDLDEAIRIADRIVVIRNGRVEQCGTPLHLLSRPATPYVEKLLDARDAIRRLAQVKVCDAMRPVLGPGDTSATIAGDCTLREALNLILDGNDRLDVYNEASRIGILNFEDIRHALVAASQ